MPEPITGDEHTCRICRGEATTKQPLIHPCKCRGSIRYIHEECLLEWLKHSSRSTKSCDICNTPYTFKTIYDPNMPKRVPLSLIRDKMVEAVVRALTHWVSSILYLLFALQLPIFWKVVGRIYTFVIDESVSLSGGNVMRSLIYGTYIAYEENSPLSRPDATAMDKAVYIFLNTFQSGLFQVALFVIMVLALFVEHEWVVRDEGYTRMLIQEIGREPSARVAEVFENLRRGGLFHQPANANENNEANEDNEENHNDDNQEISDSERSDNTSVYEPEQQPEQPRYVPPEPVEAAIRYLGEDRQVFPHADRLQEALEDGRFDQLIQANIANQRGQQQQQQEQQEQNIDPDPLERLRDVPPRDIRQFVENWVDPPHMHDDEVEENRPDDVNREDNQAPAIADEQGDEEQQEEEEEEIDGFGALNDPAPDDLEEGILEIIGLKLNISTPLLLTLVVDVIVIVFLFFAYLVPNLAGNFVLFLMALTFQFIGANIKYIKLAKLFMDHSHRITNLISGACAKSSVLANIEFLVVDIVGKPLVEKLVRCFSLTKVGPTPIFERVVALAIGYLLACFAVHSVMKSIRSGPQPLLGNVRKVYRILFEVTATAKVFVVFAVEIVVFPVYCGWLIDMCLAPLFKHDLVIRTSDGKVVYDYLLILTSEKFGAPSTCALIYWGFGTIYMLCFALYVGMLRTKILRPGVLFFIRSPEDPNARLIHDALVKSLRFQLSRIWLSAKFYTCNILLGIGLVTWGIRWLTQPDDPEKRVFLPIQMNWSGAFHLLTIIKAVQDNQASLSEVCVMFWDRVFKVVCYKLRLSHFILGHSIPEERGYIVYKTRFHELRGDQPDFSHPVTLNEAKEKFRSSDVTACFVPDGNYVRAPSSDTSRKYIDKLFIPVTKADQPLQEADPKPAHQHEDGYESDYSDVELNYEQSYDVVYRPPDFKARCILLVFLLGIFAQILFVLVGVLAAFFGRIPVNIFAFTFERLKLGWSLYDIDHARVDMQSISYGIYLFIMILCPEYHIHQNDIMNIRPVRVPEAIPFELNIRPVVRSAAWLPFISHLVIALWVIQVTPYLELALFGTNMFADVSGATYKGLCLFFLMAGTAASPIYFSWSVERKEISVVRYLWASGVFDDATIVLLYMLVILKGYDFGLGSLLVLNLFLLVKGLFGGLRMLEYFDDQVKKEKYVRGTAVQSIDWDEEN